MGSHHNTDSMMANKIEKASQDPLEPSLPYGSAKLARMFVLEALLWKSGNLSLIVIETCWRWITIHEDAFSHNILELEMIAPLEWLTKLWWILFRLRIGDTIRESPVFLLFSPLLESRVDSGGSESINQLPHPS